MAPTRVPPSGPRAANGNRDPRDFRDPREPRDSRDRPPPSGPSAAAAASSSSSAAAAADAPRAEPLPPVGPHPGHITCSSQYTSESTLRAHLRALSQPAASPTTTSSNSHHAHGGSSNNINTPAKHQAQPVDPAREDTYRLQGVQLIDNVRERLQLPLRTFDTACVYYHRFRLGFRDAEYAYQDAALAALFVACKVEDTIKKSKDILAAAYSIRNSDKTVAPDDKMFESSGKVIIGLERLILENIGFDFRTRYPQKLLAKTIRAVLPPSDATVADPKAFFATAFAMSIDMYKTFIPIKRTTFAMVSAITELTALVLGQGAPDSGDAKRRKADEGHHHDGNDDTENTQHDNDVARRFRAFAQSKQPASRHAVLETMLDLLDLYVQHHKSTRLGSSFDINCFMDIKIHLNRELESSSLSRYIGHCPRCEFALGGGAGPQRKQPQQQQQSNSTSTGTLMSSRSSGATMRFIFDADAANAEHEAADAFHKEEFEEYEIEVDEPIPPPPPAAPNAPRREREEGGRGRRFQGGNPRDRWGGGGGNQHRGERRGRRRH